MKRADKNFNKFSAKQIKTYAAILLMSIMSFEAIASDKEENLNPVAEMNASYETNMDTDLSLESWMMLPFDTGIVEAGYDEELVLESWMTVPFETDMREEAGAEISTCSPAP